MIFAFGSVWQSREKREEKRGNMDVWIQSGKALNMWTGEMYTGDAVREICGSEKEQRVMR